MSEADDPTMELEIPEEDVAYVSSKLDGHPAVPPRPNSSFIFRHPRWTTTLVVIAILLLGVGGFYLALGRQQNAGNISDLKEDVAELEDFRDAASLELDQARAQGADVASPEELAEETGASVPPVGPQGERGDAGPPGPQGEPGRAPTPAEVLEAVTDYCSVGDRCRGEDGASPTSEQITAAVNQWCANNGCVGPAGTTGEVGPTGAQGEPGPAGPQGDPGATGARGPQGETGAQGAPGPGPTDAQIAAAVSAYCTINGCVGPAGPAGPQGDVGPAGPQGEVGPAGPPGPAGEDGQDGRTPSELECDLIPGTGGTTHCVVTAYQ